MKGVTCDEKVTLLTSLAPSRQCTVDNMNVQNPNWWGAVSSALLSHPKILMTLGVERNGPDVIISASTNTLNNTGIESYIFGIIDYIVHEECTESLALRNK